VFRLIAFVFASLATFAGGLFPVAGAEMTLPSRGAVLMREGDMARPSVAALSPHCEIVAAPPARIETWSKYDQGYKSRSVIDAASAARRAQVLDPMEDSIRHLEAIARMDTFAAGSDNEVACAARSLRLWAKAGALTDMATTDANLSRDRFMTSITAVAMSLRAHGNDLSTDEAVRKWLHSIAKQTMRYYDLQAGTVSRRNNHRYWAGLSVGRIGALLGEGDLTEWARQSLEIGLCQIDADGFLPLEIARQAKAYDYHLYAYIALRSLSDLLPAGRTDRSEGSCMDALTRLEARIGAAADTYPSFERRSGYRQDEPSKRNAAVAAQLRRSLPDNGRAIMEINY
jgi:poly(beta-D-mannuronate) lyase